MANLTVIEAGMLTTVQDLGRPGHTALGVPPGGAADPLAMRAGNRLLGNHEGAPCLECTLIGPTVSCDGDVEVVVTGAAPASGIAPWERLRIRAGEPLRIGVLSPSGGARGYLCVAGGFSVPLRLGSASTLLSAGFGGHEGRALRAGDTLGLGSSQGTPDARMSDDLRRVQRGSPIVLRATAGPHPASDDQLAAFWTATFTVSNQANRTGIRLDGPAIGTVTSEMISEAAMPGAVQLTPSGQPIILGPDHPTTGGYPIIACIASVDAHLLGQLRPGERIRFELIDPAAARRLYLDREMRWSPAR